MSSTPPLSTPDSLKKFFLLLFEEGYNGYSNLHDHITFGIPNDHTKQVETILTDKKIKYRINTNNIVKQTNPKETIFIVEDSNIYDLLGYLYDDTKYLNKAAFSQLSKYRGTIQVCKTHPRAILPSKNRASDEGFDIHLLEPVKQIDEQTIRYTTGLCIVPPPGFWLEVVPRSSLSESGYVLSNSVGIIDSSYRGPVMVNLTKVNPKAKEITFPWKCCQLILREHHHAIVEEITENQLSSTQRGSGGFGSTNTINSNNTK